ncbi:isoflavone reductase [Thozetella sp. PMI_491]|nr:isoflavone reductase [Thozetella sp. PMI_491]
MTRKIQNIAVAGATGNVGKEVIKNLLRYEGFTITALVRKPSDLGPQIKTRVVDFSSLESVADALHHQDVLIDTTNTHDGTSILLIDAAAKAGVYRYLPPDFGLDPFNKGMQALPVFAGRVARDRHLFEKCQETGMTWTIVCNGAFLDWNLRSGFMGIDLFRKKATLLDGGANVHAWTTLASVGKATAGIVLHLEETENRPVYVHSVYKSEQQMVMMAKDALGSEGWEVEEKEGKAVFDKAIADFNAGIHTLQVMSGMVLYANTQSDIAHPWSASDNALLGLTELPDDGLKELISTIGKSG